uniref:hypothetical protein n=1 Tax=Nocardia asiatica TaxID=209252 RepID=UPI0005B7846A
GVLGSAGASDAPGRTDGTGSFGAAGPAAALAADRPAGSVRTRGIWPAADAVLADAAGTTAAVLVDLAFLPPDAGAVRAAVPTDATGMAGQSGRPGLSRGDDAAGHARASARPADAPTGGG